VGVITNILFPVDFSPSCVAMGAYVRRAASLFGAQASLIHVFDPASYSGFELYVRRPGDIADEHQEIARERLDAFLQDQFPIEQYPRLLVAGDAATRIAATARNGFDLIMMPTHAGTFRRILLGSTTAKVLNDADCPVATSRHGGTIAPRPLEHREWLCTIGLGEDSERVLRYAHSASMQAGADLRIIHAIQTTDQGPLIQVDIEEKLESEERQQARRRIDGLQKKVGSRAPVRIVVGPIKEVLLEAVRQSDADVLIIGRNPHSGTEDRLRDLTYSMIRDSPFPVLSI
jgi:nucleotide-binding universal stress UspA family protein